MRSRASAVRWRSCFGFPLHVDSGSSKREGRDPLPRNDTQALRDVSPLGVGGMGQVYRALDAGLKGDVTLEIVPAERV